MSVSVQQSAAEHLAEALGGAPPHCRRRLEQDLRPTRRAALKLKLICMQAWLTQHGKLARFRRIAPGKERGTSQFEAVRRRSHVNVPG
jgi:hypothetical protein